MDANQDVIAELKALGLLVQASKLSHQYTLLLEMQEPVLFIGHGTVVCLY